MKTLTQEKLKSLLDYDPETGLFTWKITRGNARNGATAGRLVNEGYTMIGVGGKEYLAHRLAWLWMTGGFPPDCIDHINRVRTDNRFSNLRLATVAENSQNMREPGNLAGVTGVCHCGNRFRARIAFKNKTIHIGLFATKSEAHAAYLEKKRELHSHFVETQPESATGPNSSR